MKVIRIVVILIWMSALGSVLSAQPSLLAQQQPILQVSPDNMNFQAQEGGPGPDPQPLILSNAGEGLLKWQASADVGWIILGGKEGTLSGKRTIEILVFVDPSGLLAGSHEGTITVEAPNAQGSSVKVNVTLEIAARPAAANPAPEGMALVPAGSFAMGDSFSEGSSVELPPVHTVNVSAFFMDQFEVTKAVWDGVANWAAGNGYDIGPGDGGTRGASSEGTPADHPVTDVSWYEAVKWANARSEKEGLTPTYYTNSSQTKVYRTGKVDVQNDWVKWSANGYRLPTEAEWEKTARGGLEGKRYPWGNGQPVCEAAARNGARFDDDNRCSGIGTAPVGTYSVNGLGLYDMAGNVWEWVWDWSDYNYYAVSPGSDPRGPASAANRTVRGDHRAFRGDRAFRGGSWSNVAIDVCVANRGSSFSSPSNVNIDLGFRLVRAVPSLP